MASVAAFSASRAAIIIAHERWRDWAAKMLIAAQIFSTCAEDLRVSTARGTDLSAQAEFFPAGEADAGAAESECYNSRRSSARTTGSPKSNQATSGDAAAQYRER
jgi:hypothetical protein